MQTRQFWAILAITAGMSFLGGTATGAADWAGFFRPRTALFAVDGDTIKLGSQPLRLLGVDAPETAGAACPQERALGERAAERLRAIVAAGGLSIHPNGRLDRYGRPLVHLRSDGRDVGQILTGEGLATAWPRPEGHSWCSGGT
jgi:endonuclease YncB( thermonuclease family)